jgi:peptidoglycan/xylan/chitin deacetylase (PgdA/CDA1 family)
MKGIAGKIQRKGLWLWRDMISRFPDLNQRAGEVRVLCLHGICPDGVPYINGRFLHLSAFRSLMEYLKTHTHILSPEEWCNKQWDTERLNILLTFDDGYANNSEFALPVLEELGLPAIWFVTGKSDFLQMDLYDLACHARLDLRPLAELLNGDASKTRQLKQKLVRANAEALEKALVILSELTATVRESQGHFWKLLSDEDLARLRSHPLITWGNHTHAHFCLTVLSSEEVEKECILVEERFETLGLPEREFLAIPYGIVNKQLVDDLQKSKKRCIFVNEVSPELEGIAFERLTLNPFISLKNQAYAICHGYY